jgi:peroxiredoxin family protein
MSRATTFFVVSDEPERLWRAALWALTAASVDEAVRVWLTAPALAALSKDPVAASGSPSLSLPEAAALLREARALGARVLTCETELALAGVSAESLGGLLDGVESLPSFWKGCVGERLVV